MSSVTCREKSLMICKLYWDGFILIELFIYNFYEYIIVIWNKFVMLNTEHSSLKVDLKNGNKNYYNFCIKFSTNQIVIILIMDGIY